MSQLPPVAFPDWKEVLARSNLSAEVQAADAREIITFLHHCKVSHAAATVELAKQFLHIQEKPQIYTHVTWKPRRGVRSPFDSLRVTPLTES